jgi:E3 ubiquitin-protein ligase BRE1
VQKAKRSIVQAFQKDAIMRQMKEYKRQVKDMQEQLNESRRAAKHHDDHLRATDAWFAQLLDEVRILATQALATPATSAFSASGMLATRTSLVVDVVT